MEEPKTTTPITIGSADYYAALASRSDDAESDHKLTMRQYREREEALHGQLHPSIWQLVIGLVEQRDRINEAWTDTRIAELCRHLPGIAPAIEVVWEHIENNLPSNIGYCCGGEGRFEEGHEPEGADDGK